ncbi:TetR/AcrR family transcriptional regulator [Sphingomonas sp. AOB5]|uniref:TetR/AcrR family transcriptional regulator n=1 Tax=Sphingomonas sp. AOB5 TaxID=3034017 RepID=UPI0023F8A9F8|nr:TetR/AcrR family transcriptional regulator [Sphingomonas sp. AOB5]MDF7775597.1 TetR/AcrR family transcriptional regulator [Sphingomonas sp. AOB5]
MKQMSKASLRAALAESTRTNILEVALAEFADKGLAGARIDEIADKTHSSKRMIYYYFGGKEELYRAVLEQAYRGIREREQALEFQTLDAEAALRAMIIHTFDYHVEHPAFVRLVMNENILHGAHISEVKEIRDRNQSVVSALQSILDKGVAEGVFRKGIDPVGLHFTISALCFYNVSNRYTLRAIFDIDLSVAEARDKRREQVIDAVLASVRA